MVKKLRANKKMPRAKGAKASKQHRTPGLWYNRHNKLWLFIVVMIFVMIEIEITKIKHNMNNITQPDCQNLFLKFFSIIIVVLMVQKNKIPTMIS